MGCFIQSTTKKKPIIFINGQDFSGKSSLLYSLIDSNIKVIPRDNNNVEVVETDKYLFYNRDAQLYYISSFYKDYYKAADAIIYMVDSTNMYLMERSKTFFTLALIRDIEEFEKNNCPIIIFANKQDLENALSPEEIKQYFKIDELKIQNKVHIIGTSVTQNLGIKEGFDWIESQILNI